MSSVRANTLASTIVLSTIFALSAAAQTTAPRVFLLDAKTLVAQKAHPNPSILKAVLHDADAALKTPPQSVTQKTKLPPSGDKHDYMSLARYFWPNPDTPDHLPYVRHDGQTNPEIHSITDLENLERMANATRALGLAYYLSGDERYAEHAAMLLRAWFLDPATKMNPNVNYAQYVPGVNTGRGAGILDTRRLTLAIDAVGLIAGSKAWTTADQAGLQKWFTEYYAWLTTAKPAKSENAAPNNHGSWFQMQSAAVAMFLGKTEDARHIAERVRDERIPSQFDAAGLQKYELVRTNSFSYSAFNLEALTQLAVIVAPTGVDLYKPAKAGAPGLLTGLDALLPYDAQHPWPHQQIDPDKRDAICIPLVRAEAHTHDAKYADGLKRFACKQGVIEMLEAAGSDR